MKFKKKIKIAIDSPAAAGAGTQAKLISKHYNLFFLDTGKIYRLLGLYKIKNSKKFNYSYVKKKIKNLSISIMHNTRLYIIIIIYQNIIIAENLVIITIYIGWISQPQFPLVVNHMETSTTLMDVMII